MRERAVAVQGLLHLQFPPTLGQTITLTPSAPFIPGLAELDFSIASVWSGTLSSLSGPAGGVADIGYTDGSVQIEFSARAGQRYVLDCRIDPSSSSITYSIAATQIPGYFQWGAFDTTSVGQDGHLLIAVNKVPTAEFVGVLFYPLQGPPVGSWRFYGCDISPF